MKITQKTQRANTISSYEKAANLIAAEYSPDNVLDYGAGLGKGTELLGEFFDVVESFEPYPQKGFNPTYTDNSAVKAKYGAIVCLNVLNVLPSLDRWKAVANILSLLDNGGVAVISTRAWKGDIQNTKGGKQDQENKQVVFDSGLIQKGFDGDELFDYITQVADYIGVNVIVQRVRNIPRNCVKVVRIAEEQLEMVF